jgi:hypothetical protein
MPRPRDSPTGFMIQMFGGGGSTALPSVRSGSEAPTPDPFVVAATPDAAAAVPAADVPPANDAMESVRADGAPPPDADDAADADADAEVDTGTATGVAAAHLPKASANCRNSLGSTNVCGSSVKVAFILGPSTWYRARFFFSRSLRVSSFACLKWLIFCHTSRFARCAGTKQKEAPQRHIGTQRHVSHVSENGGTAIARARRTRGRCGEALTTTCGFDHVHNRFHAHCRPSAGCGGS